MIKFLRPKYFFLGIFFGLVICSIAGYVVSQKARFHHFSRFFDALEPQTLYYPTASELLATAKHDVGKDKILVLIGGSSIFRGVGQNSNELWSTELQRLLGDKYKVLNYATDGASLSSFGGVVFRMLRDIYPKIIFVAAAYQFNSEGSLDGLPPYTYLFWDAYYKNLFTPDAKELVKIKHMRKEQLDTPQGIEEHVLSFLDSYFYFRNLWNWVSYRFMFTAWSDYVWNQPFKPRRIYHDQPTPEEYRKILVELQHNPDTLKKQTDFLKQFLSAVIVDLAKNPLQVSESVSFGGRHGYDDIFELHDRSKILMVQTTYNTGVLGSLPKDFQQGYWFFNSESHKMIEALGYYVLDVGENFSPNDYQDLSHFRASGGKKLAIQVAQKVKYMAAVNHYE